MSEEEHSSFDSQANNKSTEKTEHSMPPREVESVASAIDAPKSSACDTEGKASSSIGMDETVDELHSDNEPEKEGATSAGQSEKDNANSDKKPSIARGLKEKLSALSSKQKKQAAIISGAVFAVLVVIILFATHVICFHNWIPATCTYPQACTVCGKTQGLRQGHDWSEATCIKAKTCARCGETLGAPLTHDVEEWTAIEESTCDKHGTKQGVCTVCSEEVVEEIELKDHTPGDWEVVIEATETTDGERMQKCTECGAKLKRENFSLTPEQIKENYIKTCQSYSFKDLARNADALAGQRIVAKGEVVQVQTEGNIYILRVDITKKSYIWTDTVYVVYSKPSGADNIIEDDIITFYGEIEGNTSYTSVLGATITLPKITARYIDID